MQDVKVRDFDLPGRQVWWEEHHVHTELGSEEGVSLRHFFGRHLGVQGEFFYNQTSVSADMENTNFGVITVHQQRSVLMLSAVGRVPVRWLGLSSVYGSCGLGEAYADYSYMPDAWALAGKWAVGADIASTRPLSFFVELNYLWHHDIGDAAQAPGQHLKTSGNPTLNPATFIVGPHYDTSILALVLGLRFKVGQASRKWYGDGTGVKKELTYGRQSEPAAK